MFNPKIYENSRSDGISVLEIVNLEGDIQTALSFVPLKHTALSGTISGPLASMHLTQRYGYSSDTYDKVIEAVYRFPLPGDAAVTAVQVSFGDVKISAELKARGEAEEAYAAAKEAGQQAALTTRESPDVFTLQVAGIQPDQEIQIETTYVQLARAEGLAWTVRIPLTTAPRYVREDELGAAHANGQPLALLRDPGHRFAMDLIIEGAGEVRSPTHDLQVTEMADAKVRLQLEAGEVLPDRDCLLSWRPVQEEARPTLHILSHVDPADDHLYFLAHIAPPATHRSGHGIPREVILLVDHSGSMSGAKWDAADWSVERFLTDLYPQDAFGLGLFHNTTKWFDDRLRQAEERNVEAAITYLKANRDSGGTNLGVALEQALSRPRVWGEHARHLLIVTDAAVTDGGRILRLADEERHHPQRRRISVLCIDAAPNAFLATELAERGGGIAKFLTSRPDEEDITTALDEVLADWGEPILTGLHLAVEGSAVETPGRQESSSAGVQRNVDTGWQSIDLGDLPAGRTLWVAGRVPHTDQSTLRFKLCTADDADIAKTTLDLRQSTAQPALKALFGARRVLGLEYLIDAGYDEAQLTSQLERLGYDPKAVLTEKTGGLYAENRRSKTEVALKELLTDEALTYGLASAQTAFVAVRTEAGKPVEEHVVVANALPSGWNDDFLYNAGPMRGMRNRSTAPPSPTRGMPTPAAQPIFQSVTNLVERAISPRAATSFMAGAGMDKMVEGGQDQESTLFSGQPNATEPKVMLFESHSNETNTSTAMPAEATITGIRVTFPDGAPNRHEIDRRLQILIFVGDLVSPRARIRFTDIVRHEHRPLNLQKCATDSVQIVLSASDNAEVGEIPRFDLRLTYG